MNFIFALTILAKRRTKNCESGNGSGTPPSTSCSNRVWEQCGGINFRGNSCCPSANVCTVLNPWYHQCIPGTPGTPSVPVPTVAPTPTAVPTSVPTSGSGTVQGIPITSGTSATLTQFNDLTTQCYGSAIPAGNGCAVNPALLGFTDEQWTTLYKNASPNTIPWCGKQLTVSANGQTFTCTIIDTCDPVGNPFDFNGQTVGQKCDYRDVIDVFSGGSSQGLQFLNSVNGDDFYQGPLTWSIAA